MKNISFVSIDGLMCMFCKHERRIRVLHEAQKIKQRTHSWKQRKFATAKPNVGAITNSVCTTEAAT